MGPEIGLSSAFSAGSIGLEGLSLLGQVVGNQRVAGAQAEQGRFRARQARIQGQEIGAAHRDQFNRVASTVQAIRAATGASARSPATRAVIAGSERASDRNRMIQQTDRLAEGLQEQEDARLRSSAARMALLGLPFQFGSLGLRALGEFTPSGLEQSIRSFNTNVGRIFG